MSSGTPSSTAQAQVASANSSGSDTFSSLNIKNSDVNAASGVQLSDRQKLLVGSVLDLFAGHPTLKCFSLWSPNATFSDPITQAAGAAKYKAQFYGLPAVFNPIKIISHKVTSAGNPIEFELKNQYTVKGIKKEQVIDSVVKIHVGQDGKIEKLEDRWNGNLPEGGIAEAFRKLNAVTVPMMVKVPKNDEEDAKMEQERNQ